MEFNFNARHNKLLELDHLTNGYKNCQDYLNDFIALNSINVDLDQPIYRIFEFSKLAASIENKELTLLRPKLWEDPFENFLFNSKGKLDSGEIVSFEPIRDPLYGQCWSYRKDCEELWRGFESNVNSLKVKTTPRKLMKFLYDLSNPFHIFSYFIGKVKYVSDDEIANYFKEVINLSNRSSGIELVFTLLLKRLSFSYEQEIRLIFHKPVNSINQNVINNPWNNSDFFKFKIDPDTLFEEIEINPWCNQATFSIILYYLINGLQFEGLVTRSSLNDKPFFVPKNNL